MSEDAAWRQKLEEEIPAIVILCSGGIFIFMI